MRNRTICANVNFEDGTQVHMNLPELRDAIRRDLEEERISREGITDTMSKVQAATSSGGAVLRSDQDPLPPLREDVSHETKEKGEAG